MTVGTLLRVCRASNAEDWQKPSRRRRGKRGLNILNKFKILGPLFITVSLSKVSTGLSGKLFESLFILILPGVEPMRFVNMFQRSQGKRTKPDARSCEKDHEL